MYKLEHYGANGVLLSTHYADNIALLLAIEDELHKRPDTTCMRLSKS